MFTLGFIGLRHNLTINQLKCLRQPLPFLTFKKYHFTIFINSVTFVWRKYFHNNIEIFQRNQDLMLGLTSSFPKTILIDVQRLGTSNP
jgi:hypothetical protein